jgi:hypothetical protein
MAPKSTGMFLTNSMGPSISCARAGAAVAIDSARMARSMRITFLNARSTGYWRDGFRSPPLVILEAGLAAAVLSGVPSTAHALVTRGDPLEGALAAGSILLPRSQRPLPLLASATLVHLALSIGWAAVLDVLLPRGRELRWSWAAGLGIAALDLGVIGRRFPRIRALQTGPQVADHLAYAVTVAVVLAQGNAGMGPATLCTTGPGSVTSGGAM